MSWDNSLNPKKGRAFQNKVRIALTKHYGVEFLTDYPIAIGHPAKDHKFDLVSSDKQYVAECKNYAWTETGNVPSAKMAFCNQAVFYLSICLSM